MPDQKPAHPPVLRVVPGGRTRAQELASQSRHPSRQSFEDKIEPIPGADRQRRPKNEPKRLVDICMIPGCGCIGESHP